MKAFDITYGTHVSAEDGTHLGIVVDILAHVPTYGYLSASNHLMQDFGPIRGTAHLFDTPDAYMKVRQGALLGFGDRDLFVPLDAVSEMPDDGTVVLQGTASSSESRFSALPLDGRLAA